MRKSTDLTYREGRSKHSRERSRSRSRSKDVRRPSNQTEVSRSKRVRSRSRSKERRREKSPTRDFNKGRGEYNDSRSSRYHHTDQRQSSHRNYEEYESRARDKYERIKKEKDREDDKIGIKKDDKPVEKQKPNFGLSGKLAEDTNVYNGVVVKYNQPPDAKAPKRKWRLYPFKGEQALDFIEIHKQSGFLMGRDRKVADIPIDHPSCSKQHAAIQFRCVEYERDDETIGKRIRPYIIDLESANGTFVNNQKIEPKRFYELFERDMIKFGYSSREYVLLHEESKDEEEDDDVAATGT